MWYMFELTREQKNWLDLQAELDNENMLFEMWAHGDPDAMVEPNEDGLEELTDEDFMI